MRPFLAFSALAGLLALAPAAGARPSGFEPAVRSAIFYYAWYGTPKQDGGFRH